MQASATDADLTTDVLIVGAGISGIAAAYHLQTRCPWLDYTIVEAREAIGGTWDLFRYPGIRSDSDLYTFGYSFSPWHSDRAIADGASILAYVRDTAARFGIDGKIRFRTRVLRADWDSARARWTVTLADAEGRQRQATCRFLFGCTGYYDYDAGYMPGWPEMDRFRGRIVHPQAWNPDLDHAGKTVVVIGSGATAVTLVPAMAETASHVTLLQRSPSYIAALPSEDRIAGWLRRHLPARPAHALARWKNVLITMGLYTLARRRPEQVKRALHKGARAALGPDFDMANHLTPTYQPWDQRMCLVPDGDLFRALREGRASIVTDRIERFTESGIQLASGRELPADIVVTATGLVLRVNGGVALSVDGVPVDPSQRYFYKGMMLSGVPNFATAVGYTNASWTLKCELTARYVCRLLNYMRGQGLDWCMADTGGTELATRPTLNLTSGYIERSAHLLPRQGDRRPWRLHQNYLLDTLALRYGRVRNAAMVFGRGSASRAAEDGTRPRTPVAV